MTLEKVVGIVCLEFVRDERAAICIFKSKYAFVLPAFIRGAEAHDAMTLHSNGQVLACKQVEQTKCIDAAFFSMFCTLAEQYIAAMQVLHYFLLSAPLSVRGITVYRMR
jgi:hypothetical protein